MPIPDLEAIIRVFPRFPGATADHPVIARFLDEVRESGKERGLITEAHVAVLERQGQIQEQGYLEQQQSYLSMESAADMAPSAEKKAAGGAEWGAALRFGAGAADFVSKAWPAIALLA